MGGKKTVEKSREWEKGRRDKLNNSFLELSKLLPDHDPSMNLSKMEILTKAALYIKQLQDQNQDILSNGKEAFMDMETDRLRKRVTHLLLKTKLLVDALRNAGVPIPVHKTKKRSDTKKNNPPISEQLIQNRPVISKSVDDMECKEFQVKEKTKQNNKNSFDPKRATKEPLKEVNSTLSSVNVPKDIPTVSKPQISAAKAGAGKGDICCVMSVPQSTVTINNASFAPVVQTPVVSLLDRNGLANLGPGTLILADGRVVSVPPTIPQIVVKPQPALILMPKSSRKEKILYPKQDVTKTTFTNKTPIPAIKHFSIEYKAKKKVSVTKTRIATKQKLLRRKEVKMTLTNKGTKVTNINKSKLDKKTVSNPKNEKSKLHQIETESIDEALELRSEKTENVKKNTCPTNFEKSLENSCSENIKSAVEVECNMSAEEVTILPEVITTNINTTQPDTSFPAPKENEQPPETSDKIVVDLISPGNPFVPEKSIGSSSPEMAPCENLDPGINSQLLEVVNQEIVDVATKSTNVEYNVKEKPKDQNLDSTDCPVLSLNHDTTLICESGQPCQNSFIEIPQTNQNEPYEKSIEKRITNKDDNYKNSPIVCKYTIDSLFKNPSIDVSVSNSDVKGLSRIEKESQKNKQNVSFSSDILQVSRENGTMTAQTQIFQGDNNFNNSRDGNEITNIALDTALRDVAPSSCAVLQSDISPVKESCQENNKNHNKNFSLNSEANVFKNDSMLLAADLMKSKELEKNSFMPLLDDVRLTTDFSNDLFSSFQVPPGGQHTESMSPTAAFLLAFPLVSTSKTNENLAEADNPEHQSSTPTTILQIGNIDPPNPEMFNSHIDNIRTSKPDDHQKEFERFTGYDSSVFDPSINPIDHQKRKTPEYSEQCIDKNYKRVCNDNRKRPRSNMESLPNYPQTYSYPIFSSNNEFPSQYSLPDPKNDSLNIAPWNTNLNQDYQQHTVQKDTCNAMKPKASERKKSDKQSHKNSNYAYQHSIQPVTDYYSVKNDRKKQKSSQTKTPVNWMAPPEPKNLFLEPLPHIDIYTHSKEQESSNSVNVQANSQNVYNSTLPNLDVPFENVPYSDFNNKKTSNNYSWSPSKTLLPSLDNHNFVIPSTLPTLVGDLALGTSTPSENFKTFEDKQRFEQNKKDKGTNIDNTKKRGDFNSKSQVSNSFLSVSQLVDPKNQKQGKISEIKQNLKRTDKQDKYAMTCHYTNRREQTDPNCMYSGQRNNLFNSAQWSDKQKQHYKGGSYSAESLIGVQGNQDSHELFNFNNYQSQSTNNYFHTEFVQNDNGQNAQPQYQNYFNSQSHFPTFLGEEYQNPSDGFQNIGQRSKVKQKQKDQAYQGQQQTSASFPQTYPSCVKTCATYPSHHSNPTSTLTNFNLSTIFPEMNDQRVVAPAQVSLHNSNFAPMPPHNYSAH